MCAGATPPEDGSALLLSLRRMNRIRSIDVAARMAVAEAGVVLETLHHAVDDKGMRFPLTLGARGSCTIGGLASTNAGGTQVLRFGTMRSLIAGIEAVLPDGTVHHGKVRAVVVAGDLLLEEPGGRSGGDLDGCGAVGRPVTPRDDHRGGAVGLLATIEEPDGRLRDPA